MAAETMRVSCESCPVRQTHCADCVVTALLAISPAEMELDAAEARAVAMLERSGLIDAGQAESAVAIRMPGPAAGRRYVGAS